MLLERYGVVSREAALHEEIPGGFKTLYPVLKEMEERGQLRRGYFVEGLSGAQFALAGAVERLRETRERMSASPEPAIEAYAAVDPANPYGALLAWPESQTERNLRPRRVPGAWVLLHEGKLVLFLERGGRSLLTFKAFRDAVVARAAIEALKKLPGRHRRSLRLQWIDDERPRESRTQICSSRAASSTTTRPWFMRMIDVGSRGSRARAPARARGGNVVHVTSPPVGERSALNRSRRAE